MKVAIILVNYDGYGDTLECVDSLLNMKTMIPISIVVVDNGSSKKDESAILYFREHTEYIWIDENLGFSGGNNVGIGFAISQGADYVLLLNNDTIVTDNFLDELVNNISKKDDVGALTGKIYYNDVSKTIWYAGGSVNCRCGIVSQRGYGEKDFGQYDIDEEVGFVTGCMMLIPVKVIKNVGVLDERFFLYGEDLEYSLRLHKNGYKLYYLPKSIIYHKVGKSAGREEKSDNTQYYMIRNVYRAFFLYQSLGQKMVSLIYNSLRYASYVLLKKYRLCNVIEAYFDLIKGKMWKR